MPIFVQDSFTDVDGTLLQNHTPDVGGAWVGVTVVSDITISGNQANSGFFNGLYRNATLPTHPDYDITAQLITFGADVALAGRLIDGGNYYLFRYNAGQYSLLRNFQGSSVNLDTFVEALPPLPALLRFELRAEGPIRLRGLINGVEKVSSADGAFTQPYRVGLFAGGLTTILDNFLASDSPIVAVQNSLTFTRASDRISVY